MSGSVAARLEDSKFRDSLNRVVEKIGAEKSARLMTDSIAARLLSPGFLEGLIDAAENCLRVRQLIAQHPIAKSQKRKFSSAMHRQLPGKAKKQVRSNVT
eukprot:gnl/TRDRNA2_/TRDRNA2_178030_c0_seq4.p3 gnl/TRDRNA2_/TRDRNA2_178030_c0~~gnl/TRDRNA2_/TRDRNA2_178030_c0_seq4.p3  ORF type:complete len:100 (-),score=14.47 gnl/TRDRNA2_/TRDRNA2_178030_c0_seq4:727-1026(-)